MAHMTLVVATRNVDANGNKLTENAIMDLAQRLREKYGDGVVREQRDRVRITLTQARCICGRRDCWGPEHEKWCPLWYDTHIEIEETDE